MQQAHAAGAPAVVVGCLTVIDPLVAVRLGITKLGEGTGTTLVTAGGLVAFAVLGLGAAARPLSPPCRACPDVVRACRITL